MVQVDIDVAKCTGCAHCRDVCPVNVFELRPRDQFPDVTDDAAVAAKFQFRGEKSIAVTDPSASCARRASSSAKGSASLSPMTRATSTTRRTSRPARPPRVPRSSKQAKALVRAGWNAASTRYRPDGADRTVFGLTTTQSREWLAPLFARLPNGARVVDLGCGCGLPTARQLASRFDVTGVDLSDVQIARARRLVPQARFRRADMSRVRFEAGSLSAVVALYSLIHLPLAEQRPLLARIHRWLRPGGLLVLIAGDERYRGIEPNWLRSGAPMYWDHADAGTYRRWLEELGFVVEQQAVVREPDAQHARFLARRVPARTSRRGPRAQPRHSGSVRR